MTMSYNRDWRAPTASEAELIEAWKREDLRDRRPVFYVMGGMIFMAIFLIVIALTLIDGWAQNVILILGSIVIFDTLLLMIYLSVTNRRRQILCGDYQIIDSVAMTTLLNTSGKFILQVKTASDELIDVTVSEKFSKTITPDMRGFLLRYGKNTSSRKAKPAAFIPIHKSDGPSERSVDQSPNSDWRSPDASEAEQIAAWTRKIHRANLPINLIGLALFPLFLIAMLILVLVGETSFAEFWPYGLLCLGGTIFMAMLFRAALREAKQLLSGDYQIKNAVVVSKNSPSGSQRSEFYIQVRTPSGEMINEQVSKKTYKAVTENSPGFLVRVNGQKPKRKGPRINFFPSIRVDE